MSTLKVSIFGNILEKNWEIGDATMSIGDTVYLPVDNVLVDNNKINVRVTFLVKVY